MASFIYNGKNYELPKKTMNVVEKEDYMHTASKTLQEAYRKQFEFLQAVLNEDSIKEIFGTDDIMNIDLTEVTYVCNLINDAYLEKINKHNLEKAERISSNKSVEKLINVGNSIKNIERYQEKNK